MPTVFYVRIAKEAEGDVQEMHDLIALDKKKAAAKWVRDFYRHSRSLATFPLRYEVMPEAESLGRLWRHIIFGNYRIIYRVDGNQVTVLRVVHAARLLTRTFFLH